MTSWCRPLSALSAADLDLAGGKGANLAEVLAAGFDVPDGFVVTTDAYRRAVQGVAILDHESVLSVPVPDEVREAVLDAYTDLGGGQVAVRSSATAEDLPGAAFAGQQDTFLGVAGPDALLEAVRGCWASLWGERAVAYRGRLGLPPEDVAIAVVVQRMVPADHAGVMFTADPVTGDRDRVVIDSNPGLGEAVVAGLVTPDHVVLEADDRIVERREGGREVVVRASSEGGTRTDTAPAVRGLGEAELVELSHLGRRVADHFGRPQDIEWAVAGGRVSVLQARPMTALPPPPRPLSRIQRITGPVILELLPRRPLPLELGAWIEPNVGRHVAELIAGITGARVSLADVMPTEDAVVQEYVPPEPHPTWAVPARLARTVSRLGRDPRRWAGDPRLAAFREGAARLDALDVAGLPWQELLAVPDSAARLVDLVTALRVEYLPPAAAALARLTAVAALLRRRDLVAALALEGDSATARANAELAEIADLVRSRPWLASATREGGGRELLRLVRSDPRAADVERHLGGFLARYGHRETTSVLLVADPVWREAPETVMDLVVVLLDASSDHRHDPEAAARALDELVDHRVVRATRTETWVRRLADTAAAAATVREDTHFELTRTMPAVRRAVLEMGRRLAARGTVEDPHDVWYLTRAELGRLGDEPGPVDAQVAAAARRRRAAYVELAASPLIATSTLYPQRTTDAQTLVIGVGSGGGLATGAVRVVTGPGEFGTLHAGEVLVCPSTNPSWTPLFARAAAVVVDHGGLASHAAIVAREYGIPAVMGTGRGTSVLEPGMRVRVDGDRGTVVAADVAAPRG
jgi:phosphohistidine swiveling domain-containing protein